MNFKKNLLRTTKSLVYAVPNKESAKVIALTFSLAKRRDKNNFFEFISQRTAELTDLPYFMVRS